MWEHINLGQLTPCKTNKTNKPKIFTCLLIVGAEQTKRGQPWLSLRNKLMTSSLQNVYVHNKMALWLIFKNHLSWVSNTFFFFPEYPVLSELTQEFRDNLMSLPVIVLIWQLKKMINLQGQKIKQNKLLSRSRHNKRKFPILVQKLWSMFLPWYLHLTFSPYSLPECSS